MGIFDRLFGTKRNAEPDEATAYPISFSGKGPYQKSFGNDFGVVFEDDGETGYFYATNGSHTTIFDALHVYDRNTPDAIPVGEQLFVVWNPSRKRAGLYFRGQFQAVFDFARRRGGCRNGFPPPGKQWSETGHNWDEELTDGLQPT
ncbi:MAG: DUF2251 domain-containing protein [Planctomycetota bacterium]|nr:DUF2251 domain-containing protein [Planctomycetota bacterium]